jgi:flagellar basal body P-ring formation protein FlgA
MKRASNSLLTLRFCFGMRQSVQVPRELAWADGRFLTPFHSHQEGSAGIDETLLIIPRPPRNLFRPRSGEGRVCSSLNRRRSFHGIQRISAGLLAGVMGFLLSVAMSADSVTIVLRSEVNIEHRQVLLGDVADLRGPDQAGPAELARVSLGVLSSAGMVRNFTSDQVLEAVKRAFGDRPACIVTGAPVVQVRLEGRRVEAEELQAAVKEHLLRTTDWRPEEIDLRSLRVLNAIEVPEGKIEFRVPPRGSLSHARNQVLPVEVLLDGVLLQTIWVSAEVSITADVLQAVKKIPFGRSLSADDVKVMPTRISDPHANCIRRYDDAAGQVLRRTLSPGDPLTRETLTSPVLVRSGQPVRLRLDRDGVRLEVMARAEQSGRLGQVIRVRGLEYARVIKAEVTGPAEVKVHNEQ